MTEEQENDYPGPRGGPNGTRASGFGFQCKLTSSRVLVDGLSALHFGKKDQFASFTVNNIGLRVSVQNVAKTMHAVMYIKVGSQSVRSMWAHFTIYRVNFMNFAVQCFR